MKKVVLIALCGLFAVQADAQKAKKAPQKQTETAMTSKAAQTDAEKAMEWSQLDAFHKVMGQTFHPAEKGDFKPIRKRSGELMEAMQALIGNPFPEAYRTAEMKVLIATLEDRVAVVNKMVETKANDKELMASLNEAHNVFHKVAGLCSDKEGHDKH